MDGSIWCIWQGEDFHGSRKTMRGRLHRYADGRPLVVVTRYVTEGERQGIVFRYVRSRRELGLDDG